MRIASLCLLIAACSSNAPPPPAQQEQPLVPSTTSRGSAREADLEAESPASEGNPLPSEAMVQEWIGQKILDHPQVAQFLHMTVAGNSPLTVFTVPELALGAPQMKAGGVAVRVVPTEGEARFRFTRYVDAPGANVHVEFEMPSQGMAGDADLQLRDYSWDIVDLHVAEH